jgi:choline kinase
MKAVILASGIGTRLQPLTLDTPKCLIKLHGKPILENALVHLNENNIDTAVIVIGHLGEKIRTYFGDNFKGTRLCYVENKFFQTTNNIYSLWLAKEHLCDDILLLESDLFFDGKIIDNVCKHDYPDIVVVDEYQRFMQGTAVTTKDGIVTDIILGGSGNHKTHNYPLLKTVNIYKLSRGFMEKFFIEALGKCIDEGYHDEFYEFALSGIIKSTKAQLMALSIKGLNWMEIDTFRDLQLAAQLVDEKYPEVS